MRLQSVARPFAALLGAAAIAAAGPMPALAQASDDDVLTARLADVREKGRISLVYDRDGGRLCYLLNTWLEGATAAHISRGGQRGADVLELEPPADGASGDCVAIEVEAAEAMIANPQAYVVVVETPATPSGAISGTLQG